MSTQTITVPHLGGITAGYQTSGPINPSKPTLVLINSFGTSSELYRDALTDPSLTSVMNLVAIELLGHGQTRVHKTEHWTYWDTAIMNLQVIEKLGVQKAFVLGTSQGGWVAVRMALVAPERILGLLPLGTSLAPEGTPRALSLGCWDALSSLAHLITTEFSTPAPNNSFTPSPSFITFLIESGFGANCPDNVRNFWSQETVKNYTGEEGRKRLRMAAINLRERDGLEMRVGDVKCPVLWVHGTEDAVYSLANAKEEVEWFTGSREKRLEVIQGGQHFLSASNPQEVYKSVREFVQKHAG